MNAYYAGKHWSRRKQDAEYWHLLTRSALNRQEVRRTPFEKPVVITILWNDRLDIDNHAVMGKMIVDAIKGRLINDDNRHLPLLPYRGLYPRADQGGWRVRCQTESLKNPHVSAKR